MADEMADEIAVPTAKLAELLGLPADTPEDELRKAMADLVATHEAHEAEAVAAAAEAREVAEDRRIVAAAVADGRLPANRAEFWCAALKNGNREANRAVVRMLTPGWRSPESVAAAADLERVHAKVIAQFGGAPQPRKSVAASDPQAVLRERQVLDSVGLPVAQTPAPVLLRKGTDPADWTKEEQYRDFAHKLGGKHAIGVRKPPAGDSYYMPSPNDVVEFKDGEWVQKKPYRELP
jgi:hypothetical protein